MAHRRIPGEADDLGDHLLAEVVGRVGLTGEHQLQRPLLVQEQGAQPLRLGQKERGPFVGCEAAGEPHDQVARVEDLVGPRRVADRDPPIGQ